MRPALWQAPDDTLMGLRDIGRQINRLTASRTQAKNRLPALRSKSTDFLPVLDIRLLRCRPDHHIQPPAFVCFLPRPLCT